MQIVIDIPEGAYNLLTTHGVDWLGAEHILNAVAKGIPLPKGHGRLIDADAYIDKYEEYGWLDDIVVSEFNAITPTIVEADKESESKE